MDKGKSQFIDKKCVETLIMRAYKDAKNAHGEEKLNISSVLKRMHGSLLCLINRRIEKAINPQWQCEQIITQGYKQFNPSLFKIVSIEDFKKYHDKKGLHHKSNYLEEIIKQKTALEQRNARLVEIVEGYYNCYKRGEYTALNEKAKKALVENKESKNESND